MSTNIRAELNQQADNLEAEIHQLEERIRLEREEARKVEVQGSKIQRIFA